MKNLSINFEGSELNLLERKKLQNAIDQRKENLFYASLLFLCMDALIIGIIFLYYHHYPFESLIPAMKGLSFASLIPAIPLKKKGKKEGKTDDANLSKIKESKKEKKDISRSSLYNGIESLSMRDQKKERSKIRRRLDAFCNSILGKDRSKEEKEKSIKEFNAFYKKNWKLNDYKIDNFSNRADEDLRKEYQSILDIAKKDLGK